MALGEFALIQRYFNLQVQTETQGVIAGIGDDCALLQMPADKLLAVSMDTLVADVHFPADADAELIGERALRVNLSDLAAMGAEPLWFTLGLTLPAVDESWLESFSRGLFSAAKPSGINLVGGDTTRGPLSITVQVHGAVDKKSALQRGNACQGDTVFVTGSLGDGAAALAVIQRRLNVSEVDSRYFESKFYRPVPRLQEAQALQYLSKCAIDVSDGLLADLGHICLASGVGAELTLEHLPLSASLTNAVDKQQALDWALAGGDDYELCFTVSPAQLCAVQQLIAEKIIDATAIGRIVAGSGVDCSLNGSKYMIAQTGYNHFDRHD